MTKYASAPDHAATVERMERDCDRADEAYDRSVQEKIDMEPMSDLGKHLFEQVTIINEGQRIALSLGRQQMARDVLEWAHRNADNLGGTNIESLLAICNKEFKP